MVVLINSIVVLQGLIRRYYYNRV